MTETAAIISNLTGDVIGGRVAKDNPDGSILILFAGMERSGKRLTATESKLSKLANGQARRFFGSSVAFALLSTTSDRKEPLVPIPI